MAGQGVLCSRQAARDWLEKAAEGGSRAAAAVLGQELVELGELDAGIGRLEKSMQPHEGDCCSELYTEELRMASCGQLLDAYLRRLLPADDVKCAWLASQDTRPLDLRRRVAQVDAFTSLLVGSQEEAGGMPETLAFLQKSLSDDKDMRLLTASRFLDFRRPVSNRLARQWAVLAVEDEDARA
jgi:hypothetical protein